MTLHESNNPGVSQPKVEPQGGMPVDLLLVRHGQSEGNVALDKAKEGDLSWMTEEYRNRSSANYRLSPLGRQQAAAAGAWIRRWLASFGDGVDFDRIYCSPFARTRETAALLALPRAQWQLEPLLRERDFGLWEGLGKAEIAEEFKRSWAQKQRNRFLWRPESGESTPDLDLRSREMLATFARELGGGQVLCVTHEDVMWAFRFRLEKMTVDQWIKAVEHETHDEIVNGGILHYTRVTDQGVVAPKFARMRLIDPSKPDAAQWRTIERPRFDNDELLDQVSEIPPLAPPPT